MNMKKTQVHKQKNILWDLFCIFSIVGIWPRYIEPNLIFTTHTSLPIKNLSPSLEGLKILQISDLHINPLTSDKFLNKIIVKSKALAPDLIVFTGDFICYSTLNESERLSSFLNQLSAPYGCYAILGNHDYSNFVSINSTGDYDIVDSSSNSLLRAFSRLIQSITLTGKVTEQAKNTPVHADLIALLQNSNIKLLHNETDVITIKGSPLNICGLGEYMLGDCHPDTAFKNYKIGSPGIVLLHNPDGCSLLENTPGDIILSGHTHGGQVNLPWMWKKFTLLENMDYKKGLIPLGKRPLYISRGLGSVLPFRWFSPPELHLLTLTGASS